MRFAAIAPPRLRGVELLDDPTLDPGTAVRSLADIARCNRLFGGTRAVAAELAPVLAETRRGDRLTMLDVGTGAGDLPERARAIAARAGIELVTIGLDVRAALLAASRSRAGLAVAGDARALPVASRGVDVVVCAQVLHHFPPGDAECLLRELTRVARRRVIVAELRRAWIAAAGLWLASWPLRFHPVSRHDGVVSILRGFLATELESLVRRATGRVPAVRARAGYRLTASWSPA
jgi:SAM-dependent methyltransferase